MIEKKQIIELIFEAFDEINPLLPEDKKLEKNIKTEIYGANGILDSLGLVNFIVIMEEILERKLGVSVILSNENTLSQTSNLFKSVDEFSNYLINLLEE